MKRIPLAVLFVLAVLIAVLAFVVSMAGADSGNDGKVHICYVFDPRLDVPLEGARAGTAQRWVGKWIQPEELGRYAKSRRGLYIVIGKGDCPRVVLFTEKVIRK